MLTNSSAPPVKAWPVGGPSGYQISSHTLTPTTPFALVEDAIGGEQILVVHRGHPAGVHQRGRIVEVIGPIGEPAHRHRLLRLRRDSLERLQILGDELRLQQQVFRWIARDRQLWQCDDVRANVLCLPYSRDSSLGVSVEISHCRIDLGQREPHVSHGRPSGLTSLPSAREQRQALPRCARSNLQRT
jgi:hypothetical protein